MKLKIICCTIVLFSAASAVMANPAIDSIGVKNLDGKKVIVFKVKPKDTYYSIARLYNIAPKVLMSYNNAKKETLAIGETILVPTGEPFNNPVKTKEKVAPEAVKEKKTEPKKRKPQTDDEEAPLTPLMVQQTIPDRVTPPAAPGQQEKTAELPTLQYKVSAGETLYGISKRFNTTVDDIIKLNNLPSTTLTPGEILLVRSGSAAAPQSAPQVVHIEKPIMHTPQPVAKRDSTIVAPLKDSSLAEKRFAKTRYGLYEKDEKGVATWIEDTSLDPNKKLVLHRSAPIGTVIKITNPMTNRTTFAKVVGRFTENESTKDVIIVMTKNVAESLGALDKRFRVNISYGTPNE